MNLLETPVEFQSEGALLRGLLLTPAGAPKACPAVILAHGTSATINMVAIEYARAFCRIGLAALIYDHRNFGRSDGDPRQEINPWTQCRGYIDALNFACSRPEVDATQAFRWFIDYGGRPGSRWENRVIRVLPPTQLPYSPFLCAPFLKAPVLLIVAPDDEMVHCNYQVTRQAFDSIPGPKRWYDIAGGHFGMIYHPSDLFEEAAAAQAAFLHEWLVESVI